MSRILSAALTAAQLAKVHRPEFQILVYDIRSTRDDATPTTINNIVLEEALPAIVGPRDFTDDAIGFTIVERGNDYAQGSLGGDSVALAIQDLNLTFDPVGGSEGRWLRAGNVVRIIQGDASVPTDQWVSRFLGTIVGRAGATPRDRSNNARLSINVEGRMASFLKLNTTSAPFPQSTLYQDMMNSIVTEDEVGLQGGEFDFGGIGLQVTSQRVTQFVDEPAMLSIAKIMFVDGFTPRFDGDGKLGIRLAIVDKGADVTYENLDLIDGIARPSSALQDPTAVNVLGLASDMTKITQPTQVLATAGITLGFFGGDADLKVQWSEDKTQQADRARLITNQSVQGFLVPFGGEDFDAILDGDGGSRSGVIKVEGAFYGPLITFMYAFRIAASFIPDGVPITGSTIPIGRLIEGIISIAISLQQATIGSGDYEIRGEPFEYVFSELRGEAQVLNVSAIDLRTLEIENHLIDTQTEVDTIALRELKKVRKQAQRMTILMRHDLRIEPEDKIRIPGPRDFIVETITQQVSRDGVKLATLQVYETTFGVNP